MGTGPHGRWSVAYRVHDAQYWGVPQRRRRICVLVDYGGWTAHRILFDPEYRREAEASDSDKVISGIGSEPGCEIQSVTESLSGDSEPGGAPWEEATGGAGEGAESTGTGVSVSYPNIANSLTRRYDGSPQPDKQNGANVVVIGFKQGAGSKAGSIGAQKETSPTLSAVEIGTNRVPVAYDARGNGDGKTVCTLTGDHQDRVTDYTALCVGNGQLNQMSMAEQSNTLDTMHDQQAVLQYIPEVWRALKAKANCDFREDSETYTVQNRVARRLTPLEAERLQGYPDEWTSIGDWVDERGKTHRESDSAKYKALGNSIALPFWRWLDKRISAQYVGDCTLGSLFDGIAGFPLVHARTNGTKSCRWSSEVEPFCIAVVKKHFGDEDIREPGDIWEYLARY